MPKTPKLSKVFKAKAPTTDTKTLTTAELIRILREVDPSGKGKVWVADDLTLVPISDNGITQNGGPDLPNIVIYPGE